MKAKPFKAGMYLLETLTSGMYNEPLSIYREYIQNSVDSIDQSERSPEECVIQIQLNPLNKSVTIYDDGKGIPAAEAEKILSSIGSSEKLGTLQRGFRGIGRLGGIAFAKKVLFRTSAEGESIVSTQVWDCDILRQHLGSHDNSSMTIEELFSMVSIFSQEIDDKLSDTSFFEVQLLDVESFRNYIFDIQRIKKYLTQVAPLPFSPDTFSFHDEVQKFLLENVVRYGEYNITVNGERLFRPYSDELTITNKQRPDLLESVELFSLMNGDKPVAYGWYGKRRDLLGAISKGSAVSGLRVKVGNLQVGDQHLLDRCFRESRFNSYAVGEIHVCDQSLLPNSRRDDFVDNKEKVVLYDLIECELGLPISKEIRLRSRIGSSNNETKSESIPETSGYPVETVHRKVVKKNVELNSTPVCLTDAPEKKTIDIPTEVVEHLLSTCGECRTLQQVLKKLKN